MIANIGTGVLIATMGPLAFDRPRGTMSAAWFARWNKWAKAGGLIEAVERTGIRISDEWLRARWQEVVNEVEAERPGPPIGPGWGTPTSPKRKTRARKAA